MNTSIISTLDQKINRNPFYKLNNLATKNKFFDRFFIFWARDALIVALLFSVTLYCWPEKFYFLNLNRSRIIAIFFITCFSWLFSMLIKYCYFTPRPFVKDSKNVKNLIKKSKKSSAFPSGHATIFFAIALSLSFFTSYLSILAFIVAIFVSLARIITGLHWPIDILGGIAIGIIIPLIIRMVVW